MFVCSQGRRYEVTSNASLDRSHGRVPLPFPPLDMGPEYYTPPPPSRSTSDLVTYPPATDIWSFVQSFSLEDLPHLVLTPRGGNQNTYGCQADAVYWMLSCYRPQLLLRKGNVFTKRVSRILSGGRNGRGACMAGRGRAWQERWPLPRTVRILLKYILVTVRNEVAKVMFLHLSVCPQGGLPQCMLGYHTPLDQATPPPADGYCCGRYASYWNAFLFFKII